MGLIGRILATPVRVANVPFRAIEKVVGDDMPKEDRILSRPLEALAEALEEVDGKEDPRG